MASLVSVRTAVDELLTLLCENAIAPLERLVLNAGPQFMGPVEYTPDGYEKTFATNCLGYFLMPNLLLPDIQPGGGSCSQQAAPTIPIPWTATWSAWNADRAVYLTLPMTGQSRQESEQCDVILAERPSAKTGDIDGDVFQLALYA